MINKIKDKKNTWKKRILVEKQKVYTDIPFSISLKLYKTALGDKKREGREKRRKREEKKKKKKRFSYIMSFVLLRFHQLSIYFFSLSWFSYFRVNIPPLHICVGIFLFWLSLFFFFVYFLHQYFLTATWGCMDPVLLCSMIH